MKESVPRRAWNDTIVAQKTIRFTWLGDIVLVTAGVALLTTFAPSGVSNWEPVARAVGGGLLGLAAAVGILFLYNFIRAPYRQRDEARRELQNALPGACPWYFRYDGGTFGAKSQGGPYLGIKDVTITNLLDSPNSISHIFIEVANESGQVENVRLSEPPQGWAYGNGERFDRSVAV